MELTEEEIIEIELKLQELDTLLKNFNLNMDKFWGIENNVK